MQLSYFDILTRAQKGYSRYLEPICRKWDLTRNELDVLLFLYNNPGLDRAVDIVTHRGLSKSHVSLSVSTLESKGLLLRREDPEDRRTVRLALAGDAPRIAEAGKQAQGEFFARIHGGISQEELAALRDITRKISENIKNIEV